MKNFAIIGVGGYIAPRHLKAIRDTGNRLVAAVDTHDSVGLLDQYSYGTRFFTEVERFDRHLDKLRHGPETERVQYVTICTPNYLHDAHCRMALRDGADVICEKPLVINPWNLDALELVESETGGKINTILQLRVHPALLALRESLMDSKKEHDVLMTYITSRGPWYKESWKGHMDKSGGVATNIGIHFFDLLMWFFGPAGNVKVYHSTSASMSGSLELEKARVRWYLSIENNDLPENVKAAGKTTYRSITVDGQEVEFSEGFGDLHTRVYEETLAGRGFGIKDARPSIVLTHRIRNAEISLPDEFVHPILKKG